MVKGDFHSPSPSPSPSPHRGSPSPPPPPEPESKFTFDDAKRLWSFVNKRLSMESVGSPTSYPRLKKKKKSQVTDKSVSLDNISIGSNYSLYKDTPVTRSLLTTIEKTLEVLDHISVSDLLYVNKKLNGSNDVPQFRLMPIHNSYKSGLLLQRVKNKFNTCISTLMEGVKLPEPLSKGLSVLCLSLKLQTRCVDLPTSMFFHFSPEITALQNNILKAIWSLPKVKFTELKDLQELFDPEAKISKTSFRTTLKKYLVECLFECFAEVDIPDDLQRTLASINRTSRRQVVVWSKEMRDQDIETVLNVSFQLKQAVQNLLLHSSIEDRPSSPLSELFESDDTGESNDFDMSCANYCSRFGDCSSNTNDQTEGIGDSSSVFNNEVDPI